MEDYIDVEGNNLAPTAHPYSWVPVEQQAMGSTVRPSTGHIQTKSSTTLPLEYFDNPEMELVPPESKLDKVGGGPGLHCGGDAWCGDGHVGAHGCCDHCARVML